MTTSQAILLSNELKQVGFQTQILAGKMVQVSLNCKLSTMEVRTALDQSFGEIEFKLWTSRNGVVVE